MIYKKKKIIFTQKLTYTQAKMSLLNIYHRMMFIYALCSNIVSPTWMKFSQYNVQNALVDFPVHQYPTTTDSIFFLLNSSFELWNIHHILVPNLHSLNLWNVGSSFPLLHRWCENSSIFLLLSRTDGKIFLAN